MTQSLDSRPPLIRCKRATRLVFGGQREYTSNSHPGLGNLVAYTHGNTEGVDGKISQDWIDLYKPHIDSEMPYRLMTPAYFDSNKRFPVIFPCMVGQRGTDNREQLHNWNRLLAEEQRHTDYLCYYVHARKPTVYGRQHTSRTSRMSLQNYQPLT